MAQYNGPRAATKTKPVTVQPQTGFGKMTGFANQDPDLMKNCKIDLEPLVELSTVLIRPKVIPLDDLTGWETETEYDICASDGTILYKVVEETDCCARCLCGTVKPFSVFVSTPEGRPVIQFLRDITIGSYACSQFVQRTQVFCPPGKLVGTVERKHNLFMPEFEVKNSFAETQFMVEGPYCTCNCCGEVDYDIHNADKSATVGRISKQWRGVYKPAFFRTEFFGVEFPLELDINLKVVLLGTAFLIDYMYFDH